jgi:LDH2 family malate/lactate/ureidoglycolate dehydrogenase
MTMEVRTTRTVDARVLRGLMESLLRAAGCGPETASTVANVFLEADLRGVGLQGLDHMHTMIDNLRHGRINPDGKPRVVKEGAAYALVDGETGPGQVAGAFAVDLATRKATTAGCCAVGVTNSSDVFMLGYYVERIARAGCVGLAFTDSPPLVRPFGGIERVLGTNPLAIAVPTAGDHPILLDMATSAQSGSRVRQAAYHDEDLPEADGVGPDGRPSIKAREILEGAIGPLGGHKGFGLAFCVGLLAGPLVGAATGKALSTWHQEGVAGPASKGHFFVAIDPAAFGDAAMFRRAVSASIEEVKGSRKAPGVCEIHVPGERAFAARERSLREGVPIYDAVWKKTAGLAASLGVQMPD